MPDLIARINRASPHLFLVGQDAFVSLVLRRSRSSRQPEPGAHPTVGDADDDQRNGVFDHHLRNERFTDSAALLNALIVV